MIEVATVMVMVLVMMVGARGESDDGGRGGEDSGW